MARSKPYTFKFALVDLALLYLFNFGWLAIMIVRELYRQYK